MKFRLVIDKNCEEEVVATVHQESDFTAKLENLVRHPVSSDKLPVYGEDDIRLMPFAEMECVTVIEGKTYAIDRKGQKSLLRYRLYELENLLPANFIRINKSALANVDCLERFSASFSGAIDAIFQSGYQEYISRRCFAEIKRRFGIK